MEYGFLHMLPTELNKELFNFIRPEFSFSIIEYDDREFTVEVSINTTYLKYISTWRINMLDLDDFLSRFYNTNVLNKPTITTDDYNNAYLTYMPSSNTFSIDNDNGEMVFNSCFSVPIYAYLRNTYIVINEYYKNYSTRTSNHAEKPPYAKLTYDPNDFIVNLPQQDNI